MNGSSDGQISQLLRVHGQGVVVVVVVVFVVARVRVVVLLIDN